MPKTRKTNAELYKTVYTHTLALINEKGPNAINFSEVSKLTGVTRASLYRHWASPFKLIYDTVQYFTDETHVHTDDEWFQIFKANSLRDNLIQNLWTQFPTFQNVPQLMKFLITNMLQETPEATAVRNDIVKTQRKYTKLTVTAAIENGELDHPLTELQLDLPLALLLTNLATASEAVSLDFITKMVDEVILPTYLYTATTKKEPSHD